MTKVVVRVEVEDIERWKNGFVTHTELFKKQGVSIAHYGAGDNNKVVAFFETNNLSDFMNIMESPETEEAMSHDGIIGGSVEVFVLDSTLDAF